MFLDIRFLKPYDSVTIPVLNDLEIRYFRFIQLSQQQQQKQIRYIKNKFVTTQTKFVTIKTNSSHQKQISQIKNKVVRSKTKSF